MSTSAMAGYALLIEKRTRVKTAGRQEIKGERERDAEQTTLGSGSVSVSVLINNERYLVQQTPLSSKAYETSVRGIDVAQQVRACN